MKSWYKKLTERARYEVNCDQDDMAGPSSSLTKWSDSLRGAQAMADHEARKDTGLTWRIDDTKTGKTVGRGRSGR